MQKRQLKRTLETLGLELVAIDGNFANATNIRLKAPDGTVGKFTISRVDDPNSDKQNLNQFKHFARDHSHSQDLPGMIEVDIINVTRREITPVELASKAIVHEHNEDAKEWFKDRFETGAPVDGANALMCAASSPPPPAPPVPPVVPKGITQALAKLEKATVTKPNLTIATADKPARKAPKTIDRIGQVEFFKLCTTLNEIDLIGVDSLTKLADKLTKAFGRKVAVSTAEDALKATGRKLDKVQVEVTDAQAVIARTLTALLIKLSEPVPEELRRLCGEIE